MKKIISVIICIMLLSSTAFAADDWVNAYFDADNNFFDFSGQISDNRTPITVCIDEYTESPAFSSDNPPMIIQYFPVDEDGHFSGKIGIPTKKYDNTAFPSGKYEGLIYYNLPNNERTYYSKVFYYVSTNDKDTVDYLEIINKGSDAEALYKEFSQDETKCNKLGIDYDVLKKYGSSVFKSIIAARDEDYTPQTLLETFRRVVAIEEMKSADDISDVIGEYPEVFGTTYEEYVGLDGNLKKELDYLLKNTEYNPKAPNETYAEMLEVAQYRSIATWSELRDKVLKNFTPPTRYKSIPETKQHEVFTAMFAEKDDYLSLDDIEESFEENTKKVYDSLSKKDNSTSKPSPGGTIISSDKNITSPDTFENENTDNIEEIIFSDIKGHFSETYVIGLYEKNLIDGYTDKTFRPNSNITRSEFAKLIALMLDLNADYSDVKFNDVSPDMWYAPYVYALSSKKIVLGNGNYFMPNDNITREDASVIIYRGLTLKNMAQAGSYSFADKSAISEYATEAVESLAQMGILQGDGTNFYPKNQLTRGEAAVMIYKALGFIE